MPARRSDGVNREMIRNVEGTLEKIVPVLVSGDDALLPLECFFDSAYHLTTAGAEVRTRLLSDCLARFMLQEVQGVQRSSIR